MKKRYLVYVFSGCLVLCCFCLRRAVRNLIVWMVHNMPFPTRLPVYLYFIYKLPSLYSLRGSFSVYVNFREASAWAESKLH